MSEFKKMKVADLKALLKEAGLSFAGNKADLIARYEEHLASTADAAAASTEEVAATETNAEDEGAPVAATGAEEEVAVTAEAEHTASGVPKIMAPTAKLDARAKRFGMAPKVAAPGPVAKMEVTKGPTAEELARIKKRIERFGDVSSSKGASAVKRALEKEREDEVRRKKADRAARFAKVGETAGERSKREQRAQRFQTTAATST